MNLKQSLSALSSYSHPCSYLPDRIARMEYAIPLHLPALIYQRLLDMGFRRSGRMVYRPTCTACCECQPLRVLAREFQPNRSMRRCWNANQHLDVRIDEPRLTWEKNRLYERYLASRHEREPNDGLESFLYDSPVRTSEIEFRDAGRLVAVAIVDHVPTGLSAVYTYFDPELPARGLGTYAILWELEYCRRHELPYLYLGYYVQDCQKMNYKVRFSPHERLLPGGGWCRQA